MWGYSISCVPVWIDIIFSPSGLHLLTWRLPPSYYFLNQLCKLCWVTSSSQLVTSSILIPFKPSIWIVPSAIILSPAGFFHLNTFWTTVWIVHRDIIFSTGGFPPSYYFLNQLCELFWVTSSSHLADSSIIILFEPTMWIVLMSDIFSLGGSFVLLVLEATVWIVLSDIIFSPGSFLHLNTFWTNYVN